MADKEVSSLLLNTENPEVASLPPDDGESEKKKYAERICYTPGDPYSLGTECNVPGTSCKQYDCTLSSASAV